MDIIILFVVSVIITSLVLLPVAIGLYILIAFHQSLRASDKRRPRGATRRAEQ